MSACHYSCLDCNSSSKFSCRTCPGVQFQRSEQRNEQGQCLCLEDFYDDGQNKACVQCDPACQGCYGPGNNSCYRCNKNYYKSGESCLSVCPKGYFKNDRFLVCDQCEKQCETCSETKESCQTCSQYRKEPPKCDCRDGYYETEFRCNNCSPRCSKCSQNEHMCTECPNDRLTPPMCECKEGSIEDPVTLKCIQFKMVCPVLGNLFEISNSRALWFAQKVSKNIVSTHNNNLVKKRVYPAIVMEDVDLILISGVAKFNQVGIYAYNMKNQGEIISILEQNIDQNSKVQQQSIKRIVPCDKDIFLTVGEDIIKLWLLTTNSQFVVVDNSSGESEFSFEETSIECLRNIEYFQGDIEQQSNSSSYSSSTSSELNEDTIPFQNKISLIYQEKQSNTIRILDIIEKNNQYKVNSESEILIKIENQAFIQIEVDILLISEDEKAVVINDKQYQYIYQRYTYVPSQITKLENWKLISKKNLINDFGMDEQWILIQIYKRQQFIYTNGIFIKSISINSILQNNQILDVAFSQKIDKSLAGFNQFLQIDKNRAVILINKPSNPSSILYVWSIQNQKILSSTLETDPSSTCKFHYLVQSIYDSARVVGISFFLEDDPDQPEQELAQRNKCQSLFQFFNVSSSNNIEKKTGNSIFQDGGLRSILIEVQLSKFNPNNLLLVSQYQPINRLSQSTQISVQEWDFTTNIFIRRSLPIECDEIKNYRLFQVSANAIVIMCSFDKKLFVQMQTYKNGNGKVDIVELKSKYVIDYSQLYHLEGTQYIAFYSQTQIELMNINDTKDTRMLIQDRDLQTIRPLLIKSMTAVKENDSSQSVALMVVISTRLVYFSLVTYPGSKRIVLLEANNDTPSGQVVQSKFDQIKYIKQYNLLIHYYLEQNLLNLVRYNIDNKQYEIESLNYDADSSVDTTRVFTDENNSYTLIVIQDNNKKKVMSCVLLYNRKPDFIRCEWVIHYSNTYNSLSGFDISFSQRKIMIWDTNLINYVSLAILKSDNVNTKLICTHTYDVDDSVINPKYSIISTYSMLPYIMKRVNELQFSVNNPKEIFFLFTPKNSYEGSFLRWLQYIPIKQIKILNESTSQQPINSKYSIEQQFSNFPSIVVTESTQIVLQKSYSSVIQISQMQIKLLAKLSPSIPYLAKDKFLTSSHNILYFKDSQNSQQIQFANITLGIYNKQNLVQSDNQNSNLVIQNQFYFDGINTFTIDQLLIDDMDARLQENYSFIRLNNIKNLTMTNSSFKNIQLSPVFLISIESTNSYLNDIFVNNVQIIPTKVINANPSKLDSVNEIINLQGKVNKRALNQDKNILNELSVFSIYENKSKKNYNIDTEFEQFNDQNLIYWKQYQQFRLEQNIQGSKKTTNQRVLDDSNNSNILKKRPKTIVSLIGVKNQGYLSLDRFNAQDIYCSKVCFGGAVSSQYSKVEVNNSTFQNIQSQIGGAISSTNSFMLLRIQNTNFTQCSADWMGGSIYIDDVQTQEEGKLYTPQFYLTNVNFSKSKAFQGGAIYLIDSTSMQTIYTKIRNVNFINNTADYGASLRYSGSSSSTLQSFENNSKFIGNKATKNGDNIFSYASHLVLKSQNSNQYCSDTNSTCIIQEVKSGDKFNGTIEFFITTENLEIVDLVSLYENEDKNSKADFTATIQANDNVDISGKDTAVYDALTKSFKFNEIVFTSYPNSTQILNVTTNAIQIAVGDQFTQTYQFKLHLNFRKCKEGEIFQGSSINNFQTCSTCKQGYYSLVEPISDQTSCQPCPIDGGVSCHGGNNIEVQPGYWRSPNIYELEYSQCRINPDACIGGNSTGHELCYNGYIGPQCEMCNDSLDFVKRSIYCQKCPSYGVNFLISCVLIILYVIYSIVLVLILMHSIRKKIFIRNIHQIMNRLIRQNQKINRDLYKFIKVEQGDEVSNCIKIILHHFQIMIVIKSFDFYFPKFIEDAISFTGSPPDTMMQSFSCLFYPLSKSMGIPNIYSKLIAIFLLYICVNIFLSYLSDKVFKNNQKSGLYFKCTSLLVNLNLFQPTLFLITIDLMTCRKIIKNDFLKGDLRIECDSGIYSKGSLVVVPIMVIMNFILPFYIYYHIHQQKKIGEYHQYSYQIGHYKKKHFYWELVKSIMKLLIYTCTSIFYDFPTNRAVFNRIKPYRVEMMGQMDNESNIIGWISLLMCILIVENREKKKVAVLSFIVLVCINAGFMIVILIRLVKCSQPYRNFMVRARLIITRIPIIKKLYKEKKTRLIYFQYLYYRIQRKLIKENRARSVANSLLGHAGLNKNQFNSYIKMQKSPLVSFETGDTSFSINGKQRLIELMNVPDKNYLNVKNKNNLNVPDKNYLKVPDQNYLNPPNKNNQQIKIMNESTMSVRNQTNESFFYNDNELHYNNNNNPNSKNENVIREKLEKIQKNRLKFKNNCQNESNDAKNINPKYNEQQNTYNEEPTERYFEISEMEKHEIDSPKSDNQNSQKNIKYNQFETTEDVTKPLSPIIKINDSKIHSSMWDQENQSVSIQSSSFSPPFESSILSYQQPSNLLELQKIAGIKNNKQNKKNYVKFDSSSNINNSLDDELNSSDKSSIKNDNKSKNDSLSQDQIVSNSKFTDGIAQYFPDKPASDIESPPPAKKLQNKQKSEGSNGTKLKIYLKKNNKNQEEKQYRVGSIDNNQL